MKSKSFPLTLTLVALLLLSPHLSAQTPAGSTSPSKSATRPIPFHGMVSAVDQTNKTFTITGKETRVFRVTEKTKILKGASNATMNNIVENQEVSGAYWKNSDGSLEAKMVKLGPTQKKSADQSPKASPTATP
ncbi:MAG TPA: hypothetical protein VH170_03345 [Chthoniobacterales bacterium]|jgi:hypothetical protein|nr:hypothetical protein [Chthoniobacterales bacterium]